MNTIKNISWIKEAFAEHKYQWMQFHIVGLRVKNARPNRYDDMIILIDGEVGYTFNATTRPGKHWLLNLLNSKGTAVLKPNQYLNTWQIGMHQGKYKALTQCAPLVVYRDNDKDELAENLGVEEKGIFGINIHRSNPSLTSQLVDKWSAGCQVFADPKDFEFFMKRCEASGLKKFTYTLLNE
jgi:hypothetical protein